MNRIPEIDETPALLTLEALATTVGVAPATLREWKRRFGYPSPVRHAAGTALYPRGQVARLRFLQSTLDGEDTVPSAERQSVARAVDAVLGFDAAALDAILQRVWSEGGPRAFTTRFATALMRESTASWRRPGLSPAHGMFTAESLSAFLAARRPEIRAALDAPVVLIATLGSAGELSLRLAATIVALAGHRTVAMGRCAIAADLAQAATVLHTDHLVLTAPHDCDADAASELVGVLAHVLPAARIVVTGRGAERIAIPAGVGALRVSDAEQLADWAEAARAEARGARAGARESVLV